MSKQLDQTAKDLYDNRYINFARACVSDDLTSAYFRAEVRASMKANVTYKVDVSQCKTGVVQECQCDCAAGMGPEAHCKHVQCLLLGLTDFVERKTIKTLETCTDVLQTFHQAKKHLGSPVKASHILVHGEKLKGMNFDPRPQSFRNMASYPSFFNAVLVNSGHFTSSAIMHTVPPANPYTTQNDHDYCGNAKDLYLQTMGLKNITRDKIEHVKKSTASCTKSWREERCKRLCSSSFGNICKLTTKADIPKLCARLMRMDLLRSKAVKHGRQYEAVAVRQYEADQGVSTKKCGLHISESHPFLASTPDRVVSDDKLLEVKCPYVARDRMVTPQTVTYLEEKAGQLALKREHDYYYQVQGQMFCCGQDVTTVDFVVFTLKDMKVITVNSSQHCRHMSQGYL
jgi:hypothetical protein